MKQTISGFIGDRIAAPHVRLTLVSVAGWLGAVLFVLLAHSPIAHAESTTLSGAAYAQLCAARGVPLPPAFGTSSGNSAWQTSGQLASTQSFNSPSPVDIYYWSNAQGLCMAAAKQADAGNVTGFLGVICQSIHGKICFWDQAAPFPWSGGHASVPTPIPITSGTRFAAGSQLTKGQANSGAGPCSQCHAGENAFINHPGTATDLFGRGIVARSLWFPDNWPDPIVPRVDSATGGGPWVENTAPATFAGYPKSTSSSGCLSCHTKNGPGGRFPALSQQYANYYQVLDEATSRGQFRHDCTNSADITCPSGAMPPNVDCPVGSACSSANDPFVQAMFSALSRPSVNLARGKFAEISSDIIGVGTVANGEYATDGNNSAVWADGSMAHSYNNTTTTTNPTFTGWWQADAGITVKNAPGALAGMGSILYGVQNATTNGSVYLLDTVYSTGTGYWSYAKGLMSELSVGANSVAWGAKSGIGVFQYVNHASQWSQLGGTEWSHVAAGDGNHPWVIDKAGLNVYRYDGAAFQLVLSPPWPSTPWNPNDILVQIAVGNDEDAWVRTKSGNVYHFEGGSGWVLATGFFGGTSPGTQNVLLLKALSVANADNVWAISGNWWGVFNYNASTKSWQRHCPPGSCGNSASIFNTISVGVQDTAVWAVNSQGVPYTVDKTLATNHADVNSIDNSMVLLPTQTSSGSVNLPSGGFTQIATAGGDWSWSNNAYASTSTGAVYHLEHYSGEMPINGGAYWYVNLGNYYQVDQIKIYNRDEGWADRLSHFRVNYWTGAAWVLASDQSNTIASSANLAIPINVNFKTQLLMIQKTDANYLTLAEVQVYGSPTPAIEY